MSLFCCLWSCVQLFISLLSFRFLEEQNKKVTSAWENGRTTVSNDVDKEKGKVNGKASTVTSDSVSRKYKEDIDGGVSLNSFLKASPFRSAHVEEGDETIIKPHLKSLHKDWHNGDDFSKPKSKIPHSTRELCFGKWQNAAYSQVANSNFDLTAEDVYLSQKQDTVAMATALAKRELAGNLDEPSPDVACKAWKAAKSPSIPSPTPMPRKNSDRETFMIKGEDIPPMSSRKQEAKFNVRMDFLGDSLIRWASQCWIQFFSRVRVSSFHWTFYCVVKMKTRTKDYRKCFCLFSCSDILAEERQLSQDLVQSSKKNQEFRSIFQHVQAAHLKRCPSELFAQHIVAIVHHIKCESSLCKPFRDSCSHWFASLFLQWSNEWVHTLDNLRVCFLLFLPRSPTLSIPWHDSKRAIHHVPTTSCREGNDDVKKKPRDTQVESPIEWPSHLQCAVASSPLLTAFRYFSHLSYLKINRLSWLICSHVRWRSVLFCHHFFFLCLCCVISAVHCSSVCCTGTNTVVSTLLYKHLTVLC